MGLIQNISDAVKENEIRKVKKEIEKSKLSIEQMLKDNQHNDFNFSVTIVNLTHHEGIIHKTQCEIAGKDKHLKALADFEYLKMHQENKEWLNGVFEKYKTKENEGRLAEIQRINEGNEKSAYHSIYNSVDYESMVANLRYGKPTEYTQEVTKYIPKDVKNYESLCVEAMKNDNASAKHITEITPNMAKGLMSGRFSKNFTDLLESNDQVAFAVVDLLKTDENFTPFGNGNDTLRFSFKAMALKGMVERHGSKVSQSVVDHLNTENKEAEIIAKKARSTGKKPEEITLTAEDYIDATYNEATITECIDKVKEVVMSLEVTKESESQKLTTSMPMSGSNPASTVVSNQTDLTFVQSTIQWLEGIKNKYGPDVERIVKQGMSWIQSKVPDKASVEKFKAKLGDLISKKESSKTQSAPKQNATTSAAPKPSIKDRLSGLGTTIKNSAVGKVVTDMGKTVAESPATKMIGDAANFVKKGFEDLPGNLRKVNDTIGKTFVDIKAKRDAKKAEIAENPPQKPAKGNALKDLAGKLGLKKQETTTAAPKPSIKDRLRGLGTAIKNSAVGKAVADVGKTVAESPATKMIGNAANFVKKGFEDLPGNLKKTADTISNAIQSRKDGTATSKQDATPQKPNRPIPAPVSMRPEKSKEPKVKVSSQTTVTPKETTAQTAEAPKETTAQTAEAPKVTENSVSDMPKDSSKVQVSTSTPRVSRGPVSDFYYAFSNLEKVIKNGSKNNQKYSINKMMQNLENDFRNGKYSEQEYGDLSAFLELAAEERSKAQESGKNISGKQIVSRILSDKELEEAGIKME